MATKTIEIYFKDLKKEKQEEVMKAYKIKSAKEMNWDLIPLTTLEIEQ